VALLFRPSMGAIGVALDPLCFLGVRRCCDVVVCSLTPPEPAAAWSPGHWGRHGSGPSGTHHHLETWELVRYGGSTLLVNLLPQPAAAEGVSCALVVGARYAEWITVSAELGLEVAR
jgi:hypothetical protein